MCVVLCAVGSCVVWHYIVLRSIALRCVLCGTAFFIVLYCIVGCVLIVVLHCVYCVVCLVFCVVLCVALQTVLIVLVLCVVWLSVVL